MVSVHYKSLSPDRDYKTKHNAIVLTVVIVLSSPLHHIVLVSLPSRYSLVVRADTGTEPSR